MGASGDIADVLKKVAKLIIVGKCSALGAPSSSRWY